MKSLASLFFAFALLLGLATPAVSGDTDPLFINMTSEDPHRAKMAISFGKNQLERGHPLTIFLNDKGVFVGSKANAEKYAEHQKMLADVMGKGAMVLVCPMCMKHYGVKDTDLIAGSKVGNPELTGGALFKDNTRSLTW